MMADNGVQKATHQFYNNRYMRNGDDNSPQVHSYSNTPTTTERKKRQKKKIKLLPIRNEKGSDGRYIATESSKLEFGGVGSETDGGYLPAELSVQELFPGKEDDGKQLQQTGDVVIVTAHDSSVLGEMKEDLAVQFNPYNAINHRFAAILVSPFCIFLFYLFCYPALAYQAKSDKAYAEYDFKEARRQGTVATVFYIGGLIFGLSFYAFCVLLAIYISRCLLE